MTGRPPADALDPDVLDVGTAVARADPAAPDIGGREPPRRDRRAVEVERLVTIEAELEQDLDPARLVGRVADLEDDVRDVDRPRQGDRLGMWDEVDLLLAVRRREGEPLRVAENDGRSTSAPPSRTTEVPVLASKRVTTMPGDVHIGCVM